MLRCYIQEMLDRQSEKHVSFHTPGHKRAGEDITELSYSDNLLSPHGVIAQAEKDVAEILGAEKSFLLTDGSTAGVHSMLYALKMRGVKSVAYSVYSHKSVKDGCRLLGLCGVEIQTGERDGIPLQPDEAQIRKELDRADALLLTSPDYYGNFPPLAFANELCEKQKKPFIIDGAHGAHLHFTELHAGKFADMWVDGAHKSLPALTQGAVVSCNRGWGEPLSEAVKTFRTTSPSYPILASVEYAIKYLRNEKIERAAESLKARVNAYKNADWSKLLIAFGDKSAEAQTKLEAQGIYPEFNDGNYLMFYFSPCTTEEELLILEGALKGLPRGEISTSSQMEQVGEGTQWIALTASENKVCARECGIFPPCVPLLKRGERITKEKIERLKNAQNTFGLENANVLVFTEKQ